MKIQKAEWPQRSCREPVWGRFQAHNCELPDLHRGPCVSLSVKDSLTRREAWESAQDAAETAQNESEAKTP